MFANSLIFPYRAGPAIQSSEHRALAWIGFFGQVQSGDSDRLLQASKDWCLRFLSKGDFDWLLLLLYLHLGRCIVTEQWLRLASSGTFREWWLGSASSGKYRALCLSFASWKLLVASTSIGKYMQIDGLDRLLQVSRKYRYLQSGASDSLLYDTLIGFYFYCIYIQVHAQVQSSGIDWLLQASIEWWLGSASSSKYTQSMAIQFCFLESLTDFYGIGPYNFLRNPTLMDKCSTYLLYMYTTCNNFNKMSKQSARKDVIVAKNIFRAIISSTEITKIVNFHLI